MHKTVADWSASAATADYNNIGLRPMYISRNKGINQESHTTVKRSQKDYINSRGMTSHNDNHRYLKSLNQIINVYLP